MTREEAIKEINRVFEPAFANYIIIALTEGATPSDKALKQQPCEDWHGVPSDKMTLEQARQAVKDLRKMLPEYLEQNPYEDAISRQAVEKITWEEPSYTDPLNVLTEIREKVRALPSVTPKEKTEWIPVSEKLPEEDGEYLLFGKIDEDEENYLFIGEYDSCGEQFGIWEEQFDRTTLGCLGSEFFEYASVLAWMPLPEQYKAESEE